MRTSEHRRVYLCSLTSLIAVCRVIRLRAFEAQVVAGSYPAPPVVSPELPCGPAMSASVSAGRREARGSTPASTSACAAVNAAPPTSCCSPSAEASGTRVALLMHVSAIPITTLSSQCFEVEVQPGFVSQVQQRI